MTRSFCEKKKEDRQQLGGAFGLGRGMICDKSSRGVCIVRLSIGKPMGTRYRIAEIRKGIPRASFEQPRLNNRVVAICGQPISVRALIGVP